MDPRYTFILSLLMFAAILIVIIFWLAKTDRYQTALKKKAEKMELRNQELRIYKEKLTQLERRFEEGLQSQTASRQLLQECEALKDEVISGRPVLDTLLNHKLRQCRAEEIRCDLRIGELPGVETIDDAGLVSLIGNLLDNAIEAAERYLKAESIAHTEAVRDPEAVRDTALGGAADPRHVQAVAEDAFVALVSRAIKGQWFLVVVNSKREAEKPLLNRMKTTKTDNCAEHGLGTKIINRIIKEHKGTIEWKDEGGRFRVSLMIPMGA